MIKGIDHIAIAVNSADEALSVFDNVFGLKADHIEEIPDQGVKAAAKFLEKKGEGIHHICIEVDNIDEELNSLAAKGVELIDKKARKGLAGMIGFLHPRATKGVLIELVQKV